MDVFRIRDQVIHDYADYVRSFVQIREPRLRGFVDQSLRDEALWPQPLIQMNPSFEAGGYHRRRQIDLAVSEASDAAAELLRTCDDETLAVIGNN